MMDIARKILALAATAAASLSLVIAVAPTSALACDVTSPTDITCPGANSNPANPLYSVGHPSPDTSSMMQAPAFGSGYPAYQQYGYGDGSVLGGGILSGLFGAEATPQAVYPADYGAPDEAPIVHHRHHHRHKPVE